MSILRKVQVNEELVYDVPVPSKEDVVVSRSKKKEEQHWPTKKSEVWDMLEVPQLFFDWNQFTKGDQDVTRYDDTTGDLLTVSIEDTNMLRDVRKREMHRRQHGLYFMNNGEVEYITNHHYYLLTYYPLPGVGCAQFRIYQRDAYYAMDVAIKNENCTGIIIGKAKKTGLTDQVEAAMANEATMVSDKEFGLLNKTQEDANDFNLGKIRNAWMALPVLMRPRLERDNVSLMKFGIPMVRGTSKKSQLKALENSRQQPLNTKIYTAATKQEIKFDGPVMYWEHWDEWFKWTLDLMDFLSKGTATIMIQHDIMGKIFITSYPSEVDSSQFEQARDVFYGSFASTITDSSMGRTQTGLMWHYVGVLEATHGTFDKYGYPDINLSVTKFQAGFSQCKNSTEIQAFKRQYSRTHQEMWLSGGAGSTFNNERISIAEQIVDVDERKGKILYQEGILEWVEMFKKVRFVPITKDEQKDGKKAPWRIYQNYSPDHHNQTALDNKGNREPKLSTKFIAACDPTEYKAVSEVKQSPSDWSITIMSFYDSERNTDMLRPASNAIVADYLFRHDDPDDDLMETLKAIVYFGCYILVEANKQWVVTTMKKMGFQKFLLLRQRDGSILPYDEAGENAAITSTKEIISEYCRLISSYIREARDGEIDYLMLIKDRRLLVALMRFNPDRTKEFDNVVTFGLCLIAMNAFNVLREKLQKRQRGSQYIKQAFFKLIGGGEKEVDRV